MEAPWIQDSVMFRRLLACEIIEVLASCLVCSSGESVPIPIGSTFSFFRLPICPASCHAAAPLSSPSHPSSAFPFAFPGCPQSHQPTYRTSANSAASALLGNSAARISDGLHTHNTCKSIHVGRFTGPVAAMQRCSGAT